MTMISRAAYAAVEDCPDADEHGNVFHSCYCGWVSPEPEIDIAAEFPVKPAELETPVDLVNHPPHYTEHPSGVECITVTEYMNFCLGNAVKYIWRASLKGSRLQDLRKAHWYLEREIARLEAAGLGE